MSTDNPQVLVSLWPVWDYHAMTALLEDRPLPNLDGRNAYYLYSSKQCRIYHMMRRIVTASKNNPDHSHHQIFVFLGNSFLVPVGLALPSEKESWAYFSLQAFGMCEIRPGILLPLPERVRNLTTTSCKSEI